MIPFEVVGLEALLADPFAIYPATVPRRTNNNLGAVRLIFDCETIEDTLRAAVSTA